MTKYYRYTNSMFGEDLCYVVGYGYKPKYGYDEFSDFDCEEIPTKNLFDKLKKEEPKGSIAGDLYEWILEEDSSE